MAIGLSMITSHAQDAEVLAWWDFEDSGTADVTVDVVSGIEGEVVLKTKQVGWASDGSMRPTAAQTKIMEQTTYELKL